MLDATREAAGRLGGVRPEIREIRLFGSLARGERNPYADADLLVVVDHTELASRDRGPHFRPDGVPVPVDVTVCTAAELERELAAGNRFLTRILGESLLLDARP